MCARSWECNLLYVHVSTEKLDLESHDRFGDPNHGEDTTEDKRALVLAGVDRKEERQQQAEEQRSPARLVSKIVPTQLSQRQKLNSKNLPEIPIPQPLTHPSLQHSIRIRPPAHNPPQLAHSRHTPRQTISLASLRASHAASLVQHAAEQVLRPQHLAHLLPDSDQIAAQSIPHGFVQRADGCAAVFAGDCGVEVALGVVCGAGVGGCLVGGDVAC
jgi:hypothetical protein